MLDKDGTTAKLASTVLSDKPLEGVEVSVVIVTFFETDPPAN